jgi:hypothetical protein
MVVGDARRERPRPEPNRARQEAGPRRSRGAHLPPSEKEPRGRASAADGRGYNYSMIRLRRLTITGTAVLLLLVGGAGYLMLHVARRTRTLDLTDPFIAVMRQRGEFLPGDYVAPGTPLLGRGVPCDAFRMPLGPGFDLIVCKPPEGSPAAMQLQVAMIRSTKSGPSLGGRSWSTVYSLGMPRLFCDLNQSQADAVLASDIPVSLIDALIAATERVKWEGDYIRAGMTDIRIDPTPHFPAP